MSKSSARAHRAPSIVSHLYRLDENKNVVQCKSVDEWAGQYPSHSPTTIIARTCIRGIMVSTVFLGVDPKLGVGKLNLFETKVFGGALDCMTVMHDTYHNAEIGHECVVDQVEQALDKADTTAAAAGLGLGVIA